MDNLTQALTVSRDDTRRFSVTLPDIEKAYRNALAADVDVVSAMWMNLSMDCAKAHSAIAPSSALAELQALRDENHEVLKDYRTQHKRAEAAEAELATLRAQVERLTGAWSDWHEANADRANIVLCGPVSAAEYLRLTILMTSAANAFETRAALTEGAAPTAP